MFDVPKSQIYAEFIALASKATPNTPAYIDAQVFFQTEILRLDNPDHIGPFPSLCSESKSRLCQLFLEKASEVVDIATQTQLNGAQTVQSTLARLPKEQVNLCRVLSKLALHCGAREPSFGCK